MLAWCRVYETVFCFFCLSHTFIFTFTFTFTFNFQSKFPLLGFELILSSFSEYFLTVPFWNCLLAPSFAFMFYFFYYVFIISFILPLFTNMSAYFFFYSWFDTFHSIFALEVAFLKVGSKPFWNNENVIKWKKLFHFL